MAASVEDLVEAFFNFDYDFDGQIACDELRDKMSEQGLHMTAQEIDDFINEGDPNGTGYIDYKWYSQIKLEALPEGTCAHCHVPVFQITAEGEYTPLTTFMETLLTQVWYPTCVATLSRKVRDLVDVAFDKSVDPEAASLAESRLHDFGFRGCTCLEQSVIGGCAHLLSFVGSDTMSACYYAQFELNGGRPVAQSIPATEHSVMTSWPTEREAVLNMIEHFGDGTFSCVMDSYNYTHALDVVLPQIKEAKEAKGGFMVCRPDSGDPCQAVLQGLRAIDKTFGAKVNRKGFRVPEKISVIQGDGMNYRSIKQVADAVLAAGYSAQSVAYGMGGGLLQKVNRDSMGFATKLNFIRMPDGTTRDVMKLPQADINKASLPGVLAVKRVNGVPTVFPKEEVDPQDNLLQVVYDRRPVPGVWKDDFDTIRARVAREWKALDGLRKHDPVAPALRQKILAWVHSHKLD
eukprot:m51a1_g14678 putative nicotinate phosphoribosyltransferase (461) ;mRNA; r:66192-68254